MINHISWSGLSMLFKCAYQYFRRYELGERKPPGIAAIVGGGAHRSAEKNLTAKAKTGEMLPVDECQDIARDYVDHITRDEVHLEKDASFKDEKATAIDRAVATAAVHHDIVAPICNPIVDGEHIGVESKFKLKVNDQEFEYITGVMDVEEPKDVRDLKVSAKSWGAACADDADQLTVYALAYKAKHERYPGSLYFDVLNPKNGKYKVFSTTRDDDRITTLWNRLDSASYTLLKRDFHPCNRDSWWCDPKWCGYHSTCPYVNGDVSISMYGVNHDR